MDYYRINLMPREDPDFCFLHDFPVGLGLNTYKLGDGEPLGKDYPKDARIYMSDDAPGIALPDLIGNTCNLLIVSRRVQEVLQRLNKGPAEYLPVSIYNHKKRLASSDYFIINPLGTFDCLDLKKSDIERHKGKVVHVNEYVLDPKQLQKAPDLFRVKENSEAYVVSERVVREWIALAPRPTNVFLDELEQA